ncbi:MAG: glycoside hydrolase family 9 protein [Chloroflexota bacterium]
MKRILFALISFVLLLPLTLQAAGDPAYIVVNQVGYTPDDSKTAVLIAESAPSDMSFKVVDTASGESVFSGTLAADSGASNDQYQHTYALDFGDVHKLGSYHLEAAGVSSPDFQVAPADALYAPLLDNALLFYQAQRDGADVISSVLNRKPAHLNDAHAQVYEEPAYDADDVLESDLTPVEGATADVSGGWFDAGDYIKLVQTTSFVEAILLVSQRDVTALPAGFADETRFGIDWLSKMWDSESRTLYYQVGIGQGRDGILADHDLWRLPQADDTLTGDDARYIRNRPVFRAAPPGQPISPNLAGRMAAAFALCYQVYHETDSAYADACLQNGKTIFSQAQTKNVTALLSVSPHDFYPESEWRDDLEFGAVELYKAALLAGSPDANSYLTQAAHWAKEYLGSDSADNEMFTVYDVSALAHAELYPLMKDNTALEVQPDALLDDMQAQLDNAVASLNADPLELGLPMGWDATSHAFGIAVIAGIYDDLAGVDTYHNFELQQLNWALGENAWGESFVIGAGTHFPHCPQHVIANISGTLDGTPPILLGGVVNGPNDAENLNQSLEMFEETRKCGNTDLSVYDRPGLSFIDHEAAWWNVEPALDYTALSVLAFARQLPPA